MAILDYSEDIWRDALGMPQGAEPVALILEGTWWRAQATKTRLANLDNVWELAFSDTFAGEYRGKSIAYGCAYGAARAVEPAHIFAQLWTKTLIQIGTCGMLDVKASMGMVALPERCAARDGVSQHYGAHAYVSTDAKLVDIAEDQLAQRYVASAHTMLLTWPSLFAQSDAMWAGWTAEGIVSIDMETSAVIAVGGKLGASTLSKLSVWDALPHGRTFMVPLAWEDQARLTRSNEKIFEVALEVAVAA
jgi:purine-nucleoside phosphorylase